jgi:hypothetical protein
VGSRTDAALAQVVAARADAEEQFDRLEAAGRAAIDIPAKIRRSPAKAAGLAAGGAFLVLGGPKRLFRRAKKAVTGKEEELPSELLPKDVEKALKKLGTDGKKVRGTLEREFAKYLDDRRKERKKEGIIATGTALAATALRPGAIRIGKQLAERMMNPDAPSFEEQLEKLRSRRRDAAGEGSSEGSGGDGGPQGGAGL